MLTTRPRHSVHRKLKLTVMERHQVQRCPHRVSPKSVTYCLQIRVYDWVRRLTDAFEPASRQACVQTVAFWVVAPCSLGVMYQSFEWTLCFYLQGWSNDQDVGGLCGGSGRGQWMTGWLSGRWDGAQSGQQKSASIPVLPGVVIHLSRNNPSASSPWRWRQHAPSKPWCTTRSLHSATTQKTTI
jgi:hypothetical protein